MRTPYRHNSSLFPARQRLRRLGEPRVVGDGVGAELFESALFFADEERSVVAQLVGGGRVDERGGIVAAHLEEHAHVELPERRAIERPIEIIERVAPDDEMDAERGAV